jgi:hypothetical protein
MNSHLKTLVGWGRFSNVKILINKLNQVFFPSMFKYMSLLFMISDNCIILCPFKVAQQSYIVNTNNVDKRYLNTLQTFGIFSNHDKIKESKILKSISYKSVIRLWYQSHYLAELEIKYLSIDWLYFNWFGRIFFNKVEPQF